MMMARNKFKLKVNPMQFLNEGIKNKIKSLEFLNTSTVQKIAELTVDQIVNRTLSGKGAEGGRTINFKAYEPGYKKIRDKAGLPVSPPDLFFTGHMLTSLKVVNLKKGGGFTIRVHDDDKGKWRGAHEGVKSKRGLKKRPFLDLSAGDIKALKPKISKLVKRDFNKNVRNKK
jgi:hypothetical protein